MCRRPHAARLARGDPKGWRGPWVHHRPQNRGGRLLSACSASFSQSAANLSHPSLSCWLGALAAIWRHSSACLRNISASVSVMTGRIVLNNRLGSLLQSDQAALRSAWPRGSGLFPLASGGEHLVRTLAAPARLLPIQPIGELLVFQCHAFQFTPCANGGRKRGLLPAQKLKRAIRGMIASTLHARSIGGFARASIYLCYGVNTYPARARAPEQAQLLLLAAINRERFFFAASAWPARG